MKKAVIVLLALVLPSTLWAMDINQGKFELSGLTAFNYSDTTTEQTGEADQDTSSFSLAVDGSYYFMKNLGVGLILQYVSTEEEQAGVSDESSLVLIGPQVTYNFPLNENVSLFVNGAVAYVSGESDNNDADGYALQVGGGLKYFPTNWASINGAIHYQSISMEDDFDRDIDISGINFGIGLSVYF